MSGEKKNDEKRLSVDQRESSIFFFVVFRFFSETIFLQTTLTRSWWWNVASNLIAVVKTEVGFHSSAELDARQRKILLSVEMFNKFSKCRPQRLSSVMRGKRCFLFFWSVDLENFQSPASLKKKKRRRIKSLCARCFEAVKLFLIDELKLEQFFFQASVFLMKIVLSLQSYRLPQIFSHADRHFWSLRIKAAK